MFSVLPAIHSCDITNILINDDTVNNISKTNVCINPSESSDVNCITNGNCLNMGNINSINIDNSATCINGNQHITTNKCYNLPDNSDRLIQITENINSSIVNTNSNGKTLLIDELKLMVWNIHGLANKLENEDFVNYISKSDLIIFLETMKLDTYHPTICDFEFKHFQRKFQHPRARRPAGGIGILIRSKLIQNSIVSVIKSSDFVVWLKIKQLTGPDLFLGAVYIPPLDSTSTISSFQDNNAFYLLQEEITHYSQLGHVGICGDFNSRTGRLPDFQMTEGRDDHDLYIPHFNNSDNAFTSRMRHSDDVKVNCYGKELLELCKSSDMRIMNGYFDDNSSTGIFTCYTPNGKSLVDYLICDSYYFTKLSKFAIDPLNSDSDHRPLIFSLVIEITAKVDKPLKTIKANKNNRYYKYIFNHDQAPNLIESLESDICITLYDKFLENIISDNSVNAVVNDVYNLVETAISHSFPKKYQKSKGNTFPKNEWFDLECKDLKRQVNNYSKNHDLDIQENLKEYCLLKKKYKTITQSKKRIYQNNVRESLRTMELTNTQEYWKFWDKLKKNSSCSVVGTISLDSFEQYFNSIKSPPDESISNFDMEFLHEIELQLEQSNVHPTVEPLMTDAPITTHEVKIELKSLKLGKAPGIDGISNEFYKYLSDYMIEPFTILFNYVWDKGIYPDKWSEGILQPLHKNGGINNPDNFRKLTLMACMGKIFESIVNKRLCFQEEATYSTDPYQFGFRKGCRTSDNVFIIDTLISYQRSKKKPLFISFIDFSKAFDFVNRSFLYYKLMKQGYGGKLIKIIQSLFSNSSARVRWEGQLGSKIDSTFGVLQGGIISPKLFNLYLADMTDYLDHNHGITVNGTTFTHLLYADDLVLVSESASGMQVLLDNLEAYCKKWHLLVNSQKSKVMVLNARQRLINNAEQLNFTVCGQNLEIVNSYKYLGQIISNSTNTHKLMHEHLASQAQKGIHALKEKIKSTVGHLPPNLSLKMFDTHILPILEYNSEIWFQTKEIDILERIQLKFLKNMLGVRNQTSTLAILADTGKFPLMYRQQASALKYWQRVRSGNCPNLLKICYDIQLTLHQGKFPCWLSKIHKILDSLDIQDNHNQATLHARLFENAQRRMLNEINDSENNPKLRTYKLFKTQLQLESYLNHNFPKNIYRSIARFRLSSHNLNIELGRHKRPYIPAEERFCKRCNLDLVEDEFHCMMLCNNWKDLRLDLFQTACKTIEHFAVLSPKTQFHQILNNKNPDMIIALGKFLNMVLKNDNIV